MSLHYNVAQLLKSEIGQTRSYDFESNQPIDLDDVTADHITGRVKFTLTNFGIVARGQADAILHLTCARCLEPFATPTHVQFEEEYRPSIDIATGLPSDGPESDTVFTISQSHTIDLTEALRQNLLLAVDLIPVCSPDCKGLCPSCGVNLNTETCACPPAESNSPFSALQGLLVQADAEK